MIWLESLAEVSLVREWHGPIDPLRSWVLRKDHVLVGKNIGDSGNVQGHVGFDCLHPQIVDVVLYDLLCLSFRGGLASGRKLVCPQQRRWFFLRAEQILRFPAVLARIKAALLAQLGQLVRQEVRLLVLARKLDHRL